MDIRLLTLVSIFCGYLLMLIGPSQSAPLSMEEEKFCGSKLVHAMSMMCASYYSPDDIAISSVKRKGIIEICCTRPCSLYVLSHYCKTLRKDIFLEDKNKYRSGYTTSVKKTIKKKKNDKKRCHRKRERIVHTFRSNGLKYKGNGEILEYKIVKRKPKRNCRGYSTQ